MSAGGIYTCGLTAAGSAYCWGYNEYGQLGDGTTTDRLSPVLVAGGLTFAAVEGGGAHTCGLAAAGVAYCWGYNGDGELGDGSMTNRSRPWALVAGGVSFATVSTSAGPYGYTCGVTAAGPANCWGNNFYGQLGEVTTTNRLTPVRVVQ